MHEGCDRIHEIHSVSEAADTLHVRSVSSIPDEREGDGQECGLFQSSVEHAEDRLGSLILAILSQGLRYKGSCHNTWRHDTIAEALHRDRTSLVCPQQQAAQRVSTFLQETASETYEVNEEELAGICL